MKSKITRAIKIAAIEAYKQGGTLKSVGEKFGIPYDSLRKILGDKIRPRGKAKGVVVKTKAPKMLPDSSNPSPVKEMIIVEPKVTPVIKVKKTKTKHESLPNSNKRWSTVEDEMLKDAVLSEMTVKDTVELMGRSRASIYSRKCLLSKDGFINDEVRFPVPPGIKRVRKTLAHVLDGPITVEEIIETPVDEVEVVTETETIENSKTNLTNVEFSELARLVKEFGVNVTVSLTREGTEVKMCN